MKIVHLQTLALILFAVLLLLAVPAVAGGSSTEVAVTVCEVKVVKDSSTQDIAFTINGESGKTSAFVAQGKSVTIEVASIPSGKNLIVSHEGEAVLTKSGLTITVSDIQDELVTVTMKLEPVSPPSPPSSPPTYVAVVDGNGVANFPTHEIIFRITVPEYYKGKIEIIDRASVEIPDSMNVYHQADIILHAEIKDRDIVLIHFEIPLSVLKAKGFGPEDACLYHYDKASGWKKLTTWYTVVGNSAIYDAEADAFSPFAIVFEENSAKQKGTVEPTAVPTAKPTEEPKSPFPVIGLLAGLGAAAVLRRK